MDDAVPVALERAGVSAGSAVMVGDAVWDVESAGRVGVTSIGVMTGGVGGDELRGAGAAAVYDDAGAVLSAFRAGDGPIAALR